jgi:hypothetical protein
MIIDTLKPNVVQIKVDQRLLVIFRDEWMTNQCVQFRVRSRLEAVKVGEGKDREGIKFPLKGANQSEGPKLEKS